MSEVVLTQALLIVHKIMFYLTLQSTILLVTILLAMALFILLKQSTEKSENYETDGKL